MYSLNIPSFIKANYKIIRQFPDIEAILRIEFNALITTILERKLPLRDTHAYRSHIVFQNSKDFMIPLLERTGQLKAATMIKNLELLSNVDTISTYLEPKIKDLEQKILILPSCDISYTRCVKLCREFKKLVYLALKVNNEKDVNLCGHSSQ